jgi:ABC-type Mn2+/Zn2+ transport system ATPase subunit
VSTLSCRDLGIGYDHRAVVSGIDLTLDPGEALALVGTNGSGKSTLLKTVMGLLPSVSGSCAVFDVAPGASPTRVGYVGQTHPAKFLLPLQAVDVVRMGRYASLGLLRRAGSYDRDLVRGAMEDMGVSHLAGTPMRSLSGGQQQRVHLAQLVARHADLLVLDEPTNGLDMAGRAAYREMVAAALGRGASVVIATHDIADAQQCQQVMLLAGRVVAQGTPDEVLTAEHLLDAFGIALRSVRHDDHEDLILTEEPHEHEHEHGQGHGHEHGHGHGE